MKRFAFLIPICLALPGFALAAPDREALAFFEKEVRPVLVNRCFECHGPEKKKGGLRLDFPEAISAGGDSGAVVVPGDADASLLIQAVRRTDHDLEMPPKKALPPQEVAALEKWVTQGAPWPETGAPRPASANDRFTEKERAWWAIQPVSHPAPPSTQGPWARNEIDRFVQAQLTTAGLAPAPEASRAELIRRASYDLLGLPPTPEQVRSFEADPRPDAWERLVDELLESPRYGERWAQHWLDVVRWAESDGYRQDAYRPEAWPYRDYVIAAFNEDKPYDVFVKEQLAGDEIDRENPHVLVATAYLRNGIYEYNQRDVRMQRELIVQELTSLTSEAFLGLGLGCAQCHDHKFDPLLQKDYYAMQAFFAGVSWRFDIPRATAAEQTAHAQALAQWEAATKDIRAEIDAIREPRILKAQEGNRKMFPEDIQAMVAKPRAERTPTEQQFVELVEIQTNYERERFDEKSIKGADAERLATLKARLAEFDSLKPQPLPKAFVATDGGPVAPPVLLQNRRGSTVIEPAFPNIVDPAPPKIVAPSAASTGRRLALANWITQTTNPLSTRVITNRIWQHHFGTGLVSSPNDFGTLGETPSHPELLDWLTTRFVQGGWKMKDIHRLILASATYRQSARREPGERELTVDPSNRLLWRFPPQRLDAEQVRDTMLMASGELLIGGLSGSVDGSSPRRSIFVKKLRNTPDPVLATFDLPQGFSSSPTRPSTTTPLQALLLSNGEWPLRRAQSMANRLSKAETSPEAVRRAFQATFGRGPSASELTHAQAFLTEQTALVKSSAPAKREAFPNETGLRPASEKFGQVSPSTIGSQALWLQPGSRFERLEASMPSFGDHFTIEAIAQLDHLKTDASVNTLISRWNGSPLSAGWSLGVTNGRSKHAPSSVIVQITGEDDQANTVHEVVASGLIFPTGKPVYLSAEIHAPRPPSPGATQTGSVTFRLKDLSDPAAPLQSVTVEHAIVSAPHTAATKFLIGGRDQEGHLWDGQLARLRISPGAAPAAGLLASKAAPQALLDWSFRSAKGETPATGTHWLRSASPPDTSSTAAMTGAMSDFCHALFNSSEFLYLH